MPQLYLSFGSNIDEYRFYRYDKPMFMKYIDCMLTEMDCSFEDGMPILKYERRERVPHHFEIFEKIELPEFEDNEWFFAQNKTRNSLMNLLRMKAMTKDENFAISLLQQNDIKRFLDTLLMASGNAVKTVLGNTNVNTLINSIVNREVTDSMRNQNLVSLLNSQYSTCSDYYDFLEGHPDFNPVVKVQHTDKPCVLNITRYNSIPLIDKDTLTLSVHICRPELKKYLNSGYEFGMELKALENYIHSMNVPMNIKSIHAFITYLKKNVNKTAHIYASMPGDSRNLYDESGLHSYLIHNFHPKLTIRETSYRFINKSPIARLTTDFDNTIKDWMTALCLRRSVIYSRLEYLNQLVLNKKMGYKTILECEKESRKHLDGMKVAEFMYTSMSRGKHNINLEDYTNYSMWVKRQIRTESGWVGIGEMLTKVDDHFIMFKIKQREVIETTISPTKESFVLSAEATQYIGMLFETLNINFVTKNFDESETMSFGINENNRVGYYRTRECRNIIGYKTNVNLNEIDLRGGIYEYSNGRHIYSLKGQRFSLETFDTCVIRLKGFSNFLDILDLETDSNSKEDLSKLCGVVLNTSKEFSEEFSYDIDDLSSNFRNSELYSYNMKGMDLIGGKKFLPVRYIWEDITSSVKTDEEISEGLRDVLGYTDFSAISSDESLTKMNKFLLYDVSDPEILKFRSTLSGMSKENAYAAMVQMSQGIGMDQTSLILLEDAGDYSMFNKFSSSNMIRMNFSTLYRMLKDLNYAVSSICLDMSPMKLQDLLYPFMDTRSFSVNTLDNLLDQQFRNIKDGTVINQSCLGCSVYIIILLRMIHIIFSDMNVFYEWSCLVKTTTLSIFPRINQYEDEWSDLVMRMSYCLICKASLDSDLGDNIRVQVNKLERTLNKKNFLIFESNGDKKYKFKLKNAIMQTESDLYMPIKLSDMRTYGDDLRVSDSLIIREFMNDLDSSFESNENNVQVIRELFNRAPGFYEDYMQYDQRQKLRTNSGDFFLCFGVVDTSLALQRNMKKMIFSPIVSDSYLHCMNLSTYILDSRIIGTKTNMFLYLPYRLNSSRKFLSDKGISYLEKDVHDELQSLGIDIENKSRIDFMDMIFENRIEVGDIKSKYDSMPVVDIPDSIDFLNEATYNARTEALISRSLKLNEEQRLKLGNIIISHDKPSDKYNRIRSLAMEVQKNRDDLSEVISEFLNNMTTGLDQNDLTIGKRNLATRFLRKSYYSPHSLYRISNDPVALKQLDDLTGGLIIPLVQEEVHLTDTKKDSLLLTLSHLYLNVQNKDVKAMVRFLKELVEEIIPKTRTNKFGSMFEDKIQQYQTTFLQIPEIDEPHERPIYGGSIMVRKNF